MDEQTQAADRGKAMVGALLVLLGVVGLIATWTGFEFGEWIGDSGWPIFVIVPGLVLWALAFVPRPPAGVGFAIAGTIVTSIGLLLWYQEMTEHWESWSYAWALIGPGAAGLGLLLYGLLTQTHRMVSQGAWSSASASSYSWSVRCSSSRSSRRVACRSTWARHGRSS